MDDDQVKYLFFRNGWKCLQRRILNHLGVNSVSTSTSAIKNLWWEIHSNTNTFYFNILYLQHRWKFHENDNKNYNTSDNKTNSCECKALKMYSIYSNLWWKLFSFLNLAWEIHSAHKLGQITDPSLFISVQDAFLPSTSLGQIERFLISVSFYKILEERHKMANSLFQLMPQVTSHGMWMNFNDDFTS